jgi:hypothetical protein
MHKDIHIYVDIYKHTFTCTYRVRAITEGRGKAHDTDLTMRSEYSDTTMALPMYMYIYVNTGILIYLYICI